MRKKFLHDISVNTLQLVIVQGCGLIIFYLLSTRLGKSEFGAFNWALAVLLTAFGILAFGADQIAVRRIAAGTDPMPLLTTYMNHVLMAGLVFYALLFACSLVFPAFFAQHQVLLLLGIGKLMIFFSTPFKQIATGLEKFKALLIMAVTSNIVRAVALILFDRLYHLDINTVVIIFIAGDIAELLICFLVMQKVLKIPWQIQWNAAAYKNLLREALPQFGVAVFTSALSRLDWVFLGLLASNVILAEYSFAYKIFEMATLPMLVVAPVFIPRFTKIFHPEAAAMDENKTRDLFVLLRLEIIIASLVALVLNMAWSPVIDLFTDHKYGSVNQTTVLILSASMPFLYFNNFLWTVNFAKGHLKMIFYVFLISFICNLAGDIILIPFFKAEGAAIAYLAAIIAQSVIYLHKTKLSGLQPNSYRLLLCPLAAVASAVTVSWLFTAWWIGLLTAPVLFAALLYFTGQIRKTDWPAFKRITHL